MINRIILTLILTATSVICSAQLSSNWINYVAFKYVHSRRIPYNTVTVELFKEKNWTIVKVNATPMFNDKEWDKTIINESFKISTNKFEKLSTEVLDLYKIDLSKTDLNIKDGYSWNIQFGRNSDGTNYIFECPDVDQKKRGLNDFVRICNMLIDIGGLRGLDAFKTNGWYQYNRRFYVNIHQQIERNWWVENNVYMLK